MPHFELRPPFVVFHDNRPGNNATLTVNGQPLPLRGDASIFNNRRRIFAWAFEGTVPEGAALTFATDDRSIAGHMLAGVLGIGAPSLPTAPAARTTRAVSTPAPPQAPKTRAMKKQAAVVPSLPSVAEILAVPDPRPLRRPTALVRR